MGPTCQVHLVLLKPGPVKHYKAMQDWRCKVQEDQLVAIIIDYYCCCCKLLLYNCTLLLCGAQKRRLVVISQKHQGCSVPPVGSNRQLIHQYPQRDILLQWQYQRRNIAFQYYNIAVNIHGEILCSEYLLQYQYQQRKKPLPFNININRKTLTS